MNYILIHKKTHEEGMLCEDPLLVVDNVRRVSKKTTEYRGFYENYIRFV